MNPNTTLDQPNEVARTTRTRTRERRPVPPQETRDWMTPLLRWVVASLRSIDCGEA
jgi:hypothetical protein